ncbi:MAG: PKD domain-containing protein [Leptolyngbya sp. PLA1]|nr:PKD domain-containing protein [Leptolyngbya sp. PLA1]
MAAGTHHIPAHNHFAHVYLPRDRPARRPPIPHSFSFGVFMRPLASATCLLSLCAGAAASHAQLRIATWNISNYSGSDRASAIQTAVYASFSGRSMSPDVIAAQEFTSASALSTFVGVLNTAPGSPGDWAAAPFISGPDTQSVLVYRTTRVSLQNALTIAVGSSATNNQPRNTYRYDIRPVGYAAAPTNHIALYNVHLKAGSTSDDNARRLVETQRIRDNASGLDTNPSNGIFDGLPAGYAHIILGDFNVQSASQTAYLELVATGTARFLDPVNTPGSWNNSGTYRFVHTQDPAGSGGMDDRHDQILISESLADSIGLHYIGNVSIPYSTSTWNDPNHSYRVWGNDGSAFNAPMTTSGNTMVGPAIAQAIIDCTGGAGHAPVFLDLRVPAKVGTDVSILDFGSVTQGSASPTRSIQISNAGNVALWNAAGIANLNYSLAATAGFSAPAGSFVDAPGGGANAHTISMSTATVGTINGTLTINSDDPDLPARTIVLTGVVTGGNLPPVANAGPDFVVHDADSDGSQPATLNGTASFDPDGSIVNYLWREGSTTIASGPIPAPTVSLAWGAHAITLTVTDNLGASHADTVLVTVNRLPIAVAGSDITTTDLDASGSELVPVSASGSSDPDGTITTYTWSLGPTTLATGPAANLTLPVGDHTVTLTVTDNLGGSASDTILISVLPPTGCDPDVNLDGNVDQDDVTYLINVVGGGDNPTGIDPDFNRDGNVDQDDVFALINVVAGGDCP